jgi:hypothetical protein
VALDDPGTPSQSDIVSIPKLPNPWTDGKVSFGMALAYLASQETNVTFASRRGDGLVHLIGVDESHLSVSLDSRFRQFGQDFLRAVFNENAQCDLQGFFRYTPVEVQFGNSICRDLKQTVTDARHQYAANKILLTEKEASRTAMRRTRDLLAEARGYQDAPQIEASISSVEAALNTDDLDVIRARMQNLPNASHDLEQYIANQKAAELAKGLQESELRALTGPATCRKGNGVC